MTKLSSSTIPAGRRIDKLLVEALLLHDWNRHEAPIHHNQSSKPLWEHCISLLLPSPLALCSYYVTAGESHRSSFLINIFLVAIVEHDWSDFLLTAIWSFSFWLIMIFAPNIYKYTCFFSDFGSNILIMITKFYYLFTFVQSIHTHFFCFVLSSQEEFIKVDNM